MKITIDRSLLEQALEALKDSREDVSRVETSRYMLQHYDPAITALSEALAQPKQEPVAEVQVKMTGGNAGIATIIREIWDPLRWPLKPGDKLYTSPQPQRKPLTNEEIDVIWEQQRAQPFKTHGEDRVAFARAVEAAHGIKESK